MTVQGENMLHITGSHLTLFCTAELKLRRVLVYMRKGYMCKMSSLSDFFFSLSCFFPYYLLDQAVGKERLGWFNLWH